MVCSFATLRDFLQHFCGGRVELVSHVLQWNAAFCGVAEGSAVIHADAETDFQYPWGRVSICFRAVQEDVVRLRGTVQIEHSLARLGAEKLWKSLNTSDFVNALGALTGNQAMQQVKAGLKAIYLSGWQVAGDANLSGHTYPDQSLYPANSVPAVVKHINNTLLRADHLKGLRTCLRTAGPLQKNRLAEASIALCNAAFIAEADSAYNHTGVLGIAVRQEIDRNLAAIDAEQAIVDALA